MNKNQSVIGRNQAACYIPVRAIVRRHHNAHVARAVDRPDSAKIHHTIVYARSRMPVRRAKRYVFSLNRIESLPCQESDDVIFGMNIIVCLNGQLPEKS